VAQTKAHILAERDDTKIMQDAKVFLSIRVAAGCAGVLGNAMEENAKN